MTSAQPMTMRNAIFFLDSYRWYARLPFKATLLGITILIVCFPYPAPTIRHIRHLMNPNALIQPDTPSLQPWVEELRPRITEGMVPRLALKTVEQFVYEKVPYDWDWNTWGLSDYLPTVDEVVAKGKEDCDGRAVIAASLLRNFGFQSRLVTDFAHVWVQTDKGETMGPGKRKAVTVTDQGMKIDWGAFLQLPNALSYGIAVFPWPRVAIILAALWWTLLDRRAPTRRALVAATLLAASLVLIRWTGDDYWNPTRWIRWCGVALLLATPLGVLLLGIRTRKTTQPC